MNIKCYSFSSYSQADNWASKFTSAFGEYASVSKNPWDSGYQINMSNVDSSKASAINTLLTDSYYNVVKYVNGAWNVKSYSYSTETRADTFSSYFTSAFGEYASVSQNPWDSGYQINMNVYDQYKANAISQILSTKLYNELKSDSPTGGKTLNMPVNCNQKYYKNEQYIIDFGCAVCCCVDVASYYGKKVYTLAEMKALGAYIINKGAQWWNVPCVKFFKDETEGSQVNFINKIRQEIDNNHPVLVHSIKGNDYEHWVVAYSYKGLGNTTSLINVLDPAGDSNTSTGKIRTLYDAMDWSHDTFTIDRLMLTSSK